MSDKSLSLAEKKQIQEAYMNAKNYAMGLRTDITAVYLVSPNGKNSQVLMGNFNPKNQTITTAFSTDKHNNIKTDFSSFYFVQSRENSHLQDFKDGIYRADIDGNQETRANARATDSLNYFNKALGISSKGNSDIGIYSFSASNSMANKSTLINNLRIFSGLDYSKSRNVDLNYMNKNESAYTLVNLKDKIFTDEDNEITVFAHGSAGSVLDGRNGPNELGLYPTMDIKQLADEIRQTDKWKSGKVTSIRLYVCYSAVSSGTEDSVAQRLADVLKVPVIGYTGKYIISRDIYREENKHYGIPLFDGPEKGTSEKTVEPRGERKSNETQNDQAIHFISVFCPCI